MAEKREFETAHVEVRMRSQAVNTVYLNKITPPEYLLLQKVHGADAAKIISLQGPDIEQRFDEHGNLLQRSRPPAALREKLIGKYTQKVFQSVFPGASPTLPFTFKDAGLDIEGTQYEDELEGWFVVRKADGSEPEAAVETPKAKTAVSGGRAKQETKAASADDMI